MTRLLRALIPLACGALVALACASSATARDTAPPVLTDVQKLTIMTTAQRLEIAQLRARDAQRELEGLLKSLQVAGFDLNLQTLTYTPAAPPAKGEPAKK